MNLPARRSLFGRAVEAVFWWVARLRSGRAVHLKGTLFHAQLRVDGDSLTGAALGGPWTRPALVRLSPGRRPGPVRRTARPCAARSPGPAVTDPTATFVGPLDAVLRLIGGRLTPAHTPAGVEVIGDVTLDDLRAVFPGY